MDYGIDAAQVTATMAVFYTHTEDSGAVLPFTIYASDGVTIIRQISANDPRWSAAVITVAGLTPETTYIAKLDNYPTQTATFTTLADGPKTATESQWEDLASKVKAKPTITLTSTDPGEGQPLATNQFIAVYEP